MTKNQNDMVGRANDVSKLVRPKFGPGMLLQHEDLELATNYTRDLSRLLFRSFFGCGVVCGLVVKVQASKCGKLTVEVAPGLALDCAGDPVYVPKRQVVVIGDCEEEVDRLWVLLCGRTKSCAPRTSMCGDDDDSQSAPTRLRDAFEIRIVSALPKCVCGCLGTYAGEFESDCKCVDPEHPAYQGHYAGECFTCDADGKQEGKCGCCGSCGSCGDCDCILLAKLCSTDGEWHVDHGVRRFIRPVLMRDPQVEKEKKEQNGSGIVEAGDGPQEINPNVIP